MADAITITNPDGQIAILASGYTYLGAAPIILSITPNSGPAAGGQTVTITGQHFQTGCTVLFAANQATNVVVAPDGLSLTCVTPPQA